MTKEEAIALVASGLDSVDLIGRLRAELAEARAQLREDRTGSMAWRLRNMTAERDALQREVDRLREVEAQYRPLVEAAHAFGKEVELDEWQMPQSYDPLMEALAALDGGDKS